MRASTSGGIGPLAVKLSSNRVEHVQLGLTTRVRYEVSKRVACLAWIDAPERD